MTTPFDTHQNFSSNGMEPESNFKQKLKKFLIFALVFLGGYTGANFYDFAKVKSLVAYLAKDIAPKQNVVVNNPPKYEFYTMLQNDSHYAQAHKANAEPKSVKKEPVKNSNTTNVTKVVTANTKNQTTKNDNKKSTYLIQAASFRYRHEADRMKASLILKGFPANVILISRDKTNWYRVMIGPYASREQAQKVQIAIAKSERINGMVRKMDA